MRLRSHKAVNYTDHHQPTRAERQRARMRVELKPTKKEPSKSTKSTESSIKITKILPKSCSRFELRDCRVVLDRIDLSKYQLTCKIAHGLRVNLTQLAKTAAKKKPAASSAGARLRSTRYSKQSAPWH